MSFAQRGKQSSLSAPNQDRRVERAMLQYGVRSRLIHVPPTLDGWSGSRSDRLDSSAANSVHDQDSKTLGVSCPAIIERMVKSNLHSA